MWFLRPLGLIKFRQPAMRRHNIVCRLHHTVALQANTGHSPNAASMLPTVFIDGTPAPKRSKVFDQGGPAMTCSDNV